MAWSSRRPVGERRGLEPAGQAVGGPQALARFGSPLLSI
jgi:hypothetical protein